MKWIVMAVDDTAESHMGVSREEAFSGRTFPESTWYGFPARIVAVEDQEPPAPPWTPVLPEVPGHSEKSGAFTQHRVCFCDETVDLDVLIETTVEDRAEALGRVYRHLLEWPVRR